MTTDRRQKSSLFTACSKGTWTCGNWEQIQWHTGWKIWIRDARITHPNYLRYFCKKFLQHKGGLFKLPVLKCRIIIIKFCFIFSHFRWRQRKSSILSKPNRHHYLVRSHIFIQSNKLKNCINYFVIQNTVWFVNWSLQWFTSQASVSPWA